MIRKSVLDVEQRLKIRLLYEPLPKQAEFHTSDAKYRCYASGFGGGKTFCGAAEAIRLSLQFPNNLGLIGRSTIPELRDSTRKEVLDFPVEVDGKEMRFVDSPLVKSFNKADNELVLFNESRIIFRPLDDAFQKIKSLNLGWFWIDELTEVSEEIWLGLIGRMRRKGVKRLGWGTTNPEGHDWVWKRFIANQDPRYALIHTSSVDNPYLPDGYIQSLISNYPEEWVKRYVYGSFDTFEGLIYKDFRDASPYVIPNRQLPEDWYRFVAIDHGYRNPTAVLWFAVAPGGQVYVYDEFFATQKLVSEISEIIKTKNDKQSIRMYLIDPSCRNKDGKTGRSIIDEFMDNGLYLEPANNEVRAGINHVQEYFRIKDGLPKIQIFNSCRNLITELQTYKWKDLKPGAVIDAPERPLKKADHAVDALRYGINYLYETPNLRKSERTTDWRTNLFKGADSLNHWMAD